MKRTIRVLLAEDEKTDVILFKKIITSQLISGSYDVHVLNARSKDEILDKKNDNIDIAFLDQQLGKDSGLDLISVIKSEVGGVFPIVVYTNCHLEDFKIKCLEKGASAVYIKYLQSNELAKIFGKYFPV